MTKEQDKLVGTRNFRDALSYTPFQRGKLWRSDRIPSHPTSGDRAKILGLGVTDLVDFSGGSDPKLPGIKVHELPITLRGANKQEKYRDGIHNPTWRHRYGRGIEIMVDAKGNVIFHCKEGKDRTGEEDAIVMEILGVDRPLIYKNYLRSRAYLGPTVVYPSWLDAMYSQISKDFGRGDKGMHNFLTNGLELTDEQLTEFRAKYGQPQNVAA